jgi:hypothetical protein
MHHKVPSWLSFRAAGAVVVLLATILSAISGVHAAAQATAGGNAADIWRQVFPMLRPSSADNPAGLLTAEEWDDLEASPQMPLTHRTDLTEAERERAKVFLAKLAPLLSTIADASAERRCDFGLDRREGFELVLPHLGPMRRSVHLLQLQSEVQRGDGDMTGFVQTQGAVVRIAMQPVQDEMVIGSLVGAAIAHSAMQYTRAAIDQGQCTQQAAKDLIEAMAPLQGDDPMRFAAGPLHEFEALEATLTRSSERGQEARDFYERLGVPPTDFDGSARPGPRELLHALPQVKPIFDMQAQAMAEPDPAKARALLAKADAMAQALPPSASAFRIMLPDLGRVMQSRDRLKSDVAALMKTLQAIADDPSGAARHTAPAILWARVAARVCALPDDTQAAVELVRAKGLTEAGESAEKALACLEDCDATIFEAMRVAAACERTVLDFSKVPGLGAWPPLPTFGGLRGAARLAALRARMLETDRALEHVDLALAAVAALGSDPSQAASCTSAAIARELVPGIADIARRADMDEARRAKLEASIARIDRRDAFGFRASLVAERARVADQLRSLDDGSEQFDRDLRRRNAEWIMAARIELGRVHAPIENPGALESIDDLFPAERLKTARVSSDAIAEHLQRQRRARNEEGGKAAKGRNPLATLPVEPIRDPATDATEAQATLSALDAALKPRTPAR